MANRESDHFLLPLDKGSCNLENIPHVFAHIKLAHVNLRDLRSSDKIFELENIAYITNADVIAVSETFLTNNAAVLYNIREFEHCSLVRTTRGGGGVSIFVHQSFTIVSSECYASDDESAQLLLCRIQR